jgi:hypothetical protein
MGYSNRDGRIHLCADNKVTINQHLLDDKYPTAKIEEIFTKMTGRKFFSPWMFIKLTCTYQPMPTAPSCKQFPYMVNRLMSDIKTAPNVYKKFTDQTLQGLEGVACFFDDIVIQGSTTQQTYQKLCGVLQQLCEKNLHLNKGKCQFLKTSVHYLESDAHG